MLFWIFHVGEQPPILENFRPQRISKLCDALTGRGHSVVRWASSFDHSTKSFISDRDVEMRLGEKQTLVLAKSKGYSKNISLRRRIDHRHVAKRLVRLARNRQKPDLILVCTPPYELAYEVVKLASDWHVPVVVDVRDEWPEIFVKRLPGILQAAGRLALWRDFRKLRQALSGATALTSMVHDLLDWGLREGSRQATELDRVFYLGGNDYGGPDLTPREEVRIILDRIKGKPTFLFAGSFGYANPPAHMVDIARRLNNEGYENIQFVLAGDGPDFEKTRASAADLENVLLPGWMSEPELALIAEHALAGLIPSSQDRAIFPNKTFTYFALGLPVVVATRGEAKDLIDKHRLGLTCKPNDREDIYFAVRKFIDDPALAQELRNNVVSVYPEIFASARIYDDFAQHLQRLAQH